ncbi:MAG: Flp family type IVb pilin [Pseudomonadota bacterium]
MMDLFSRLLRRCMGDDRASTVVEYGLLIALLVLAIFAAISALGNPTQSNYENIVNMWPE